MQIDLVYFEGCPHVTTARQRLQDAVRSVSPSLQWTEWDSDATTTPTRFRGYSSPTVLVNGVDVEGKARAIGSGCAVGGGPSVEALRAALVAAIR